MQRWRLHRDPGLRPVRAPPAVPADAELDPPLAALPELTERPLEEREAKSAPAPGTPDADATDPAGAEPFAIGAKRGRDLVVVPDGGPERGVERRHLDPVLLE